MHLGRLTACSDVGDDGLAMRILQLTCSRQGRKNQAAVFLQMADQKEHSQLLVLGDVLDARMAQARVCDAEDDLVQEAFILFDEVLRRDVSGL